MFIAAFVAGLAVQFGFKEAGRHSVEFSEEWGQLFNFSVFFLFGLISVRSWPQFSLGLALYAVLSLTLVRMLPVAIALIGTRLSLVSVLFMGWFRSAWASIDSSRVSLSGAGNPSARRTDDSAGDYRNSAAQHLCSRA